MATLKGITDGFDFIIHRQLYTFEFGYVFTIR